jgi:hypothetical protein
MSRPANLQSAETSNESREIGKWTRVYAQNRSLGVVVFLVLYLLLTAGIGLPSYFGGAAYLYGQWTVFWLCVTILIAALAATVYLAVPWWGGKLIERITQQLYVGEGNVQLACPKSDSRKLVSACLGVMLLVCVLASVVLGFLGVLP